MLRRTYKRRTKSFWRFQTLRDLVSDSMAIDMGSANTVISVRGRGIVIDEPSVVAVSKQTGEAVAIGREAEEMQGREARELSLVWPVADGVVADFDNTQKMLAYFVRAARGGFSHFSRRAVMSILSGLTHVEHRALLAAAEHAHIGRVYMVEEGLAAAIGAGVNVEDRRASAVIDMGGDSTNIAVVALGMIVYSRAERTGSRDIDRAISERLRRFRALAVGPLTAEKLKVELGSATEPADAARSVPVKGRDVTTGGPGAINVTAEDIYTVAQPVLHKIAGAVRTALAELPPEVAADIYDRGLIVTGGGAQLAGLADFLQRETSLPTRVAEDPRYASVRGLAQLFDEPLLLRRVTRNEQSLLLDSEAFEVS